VLLADWVEVETELEEVVLELDLERANAAPPMTMIIITTTTIPIVAVLERAFFVFLGVRIANILELTRYFNNFPTARRRFLLFENPNPQ
jgi:hypothetical protein